MHVKNVKREIDFISNRAIFSKGKIPIHCSKIADHDKNKHDKSYVTEEQFLSIFVKTFKLKIYFMMFIYKVFNSEIYL